MASLDLCGATSGLLAQIQGKMVRFLLGQSSLGSAGCTVYLAIRGSGALFTWPAKLLPSESVLFKGFLPFSTVWDRMRLCFELNILSAGSSSSF